MSDRAPLMRVALGEAPADLLVTGGTVLNVYTEEWLRWDVAVAGERIAAVGPDLSALDGPATERLDATGRVLVPGFIDGHTHADAWVTVPELLREAIPRQAIPALRLTTRGLLDVKTQQRLPVLL